MVSGIFSAKGAKEKEGVLTADCADGTDVPSKKVRRGADIDEGRLDLQALARLRPDRSSRWRRNFTV